MAFARRIFPGFIAESVRTAYTADVAEADCCCVLSPAVSKQHRQGGCPRRYDIGLPALKIAPSPKGANPEVAQKLSYFKHWNNVRWVP
jgi:hypothetical protein